MNYVMLDGKKSIVEKATYTALEEIAERLGYKTHSAVLKRIRKIGKAYEKYAGVDYGFSEKKIV